ncbi:glycosyltransferase family 4 protein [Patescibacteria group bacterium]|nr:glycosyltransferase family 4 protein [Patescibacteria group bacterium]
MIIGIDASRANRALRTGTEWYSFYIIQSLASIDRTNQYILYIDKELEPDLAQALKPYPNFSFKILKWPLKYFWTLGRLSWEMLNNPPQVLFVPAHSLPLIHPRHTVNTIHDIAFMREAELYQKKKVRLENRLLKGLLNIFTRLITRGRYQSNSLDYLKWSTAYSLKHSRQVIAVSNFTKQELLATYKQADDKKIKVVYNGYPEKLYRFIESDVQRKAILDKYALREPFFLYVGRLEKKKNTHTLVEAFAIFKESHPESNTQLVLIGNAGYGYDEVKYILEEYNLSREVIMPGWIPEVDMPAIFSAATAFVFPTLHEGFGIPVIQAMACGVPTLVSDIPVLREIAATASLFFDPRDRMQLAEVIHRVDVDASLRQELKTKGLARAAQFSWQKSAAETLQILTTLE